MRLLIVSLLPLALCLVALPAGAQVVYDNGPINGTIDAWTINFGFAVSDSFTISGSGADLTGMAFGAWLYPGISVYSAEVVISSSEFGGTVYSDQMLPFNQTGCVLNQYGFNVCTETGRFFTDVNLAPGTYWMTLTATSSDGDAPVYWDENSGPSSASENSLGTIPSESFTLFGTASSGTGGTTPEPSSAMLFASGILGLAGVMRRKLF